jgi:cyclic beta-1,2-glucan synthetase
VLDPIFSLRRRVSLAPGADVQLVFWALAAAARDAVLGRAAACRPPEATEHAFAASLQTATQRLKQSQRTETDAVQLQRLRAALFYPDPDRRAPAAQIARAAGGAPVLWAHGISGDRPIVLARFRRADQLALATQLEGAQRWWQQMGVAVDLVAVITDANTDIARALDALKKMQREGRGQFFVLRDGDLTDAQRDGLAAAACIVLDGEDGDLAAQLQDRHTPVVRLEPRSTFCSFTPDASANCRRVPDAADDALEFFNGLGGFSANGTEYVIELTGHECTPMPWINVIANAGFGFMVSAEGGGSAWSVNSQKNVITGWSNDPVRDPPGDVLYIRDTSSGTLWSATPAPIRTGARFTVHHGRGYTRFSQRVDDISSDLLQFVPVDDPVKISRLRLKNESQQPRRLQVTAYVEWALGATGETTAPWVVTARDEATGALTARNDWRPDYAGRMAFAALLDRSGEWTCDRHEFLGDLGRLSAPAALLHDTKLTQACGAGLSPCAALKTGITLKPGEEKDVVFLLGETTDPISAQKLLQRYRDANVQRVFDAVTGHWSDLCKGLQVITPDRQLDLLVNGWLPYQIISCRLHARTAFYQASGAWGFRDQLQDVSALPLIAPRLVREHLLRAAGRQFTEGDAQHWWLPPTGAGVRTHIADDRLWLPLVAAHYVATTGDTAVLDEPAPFLKCKPLPADRVDDFGVPEPSGEKADLFEHCARAIDVSLDTGPHGLPLFGTGDWNDGMNRVGHGGRGESVWMAWFLIAVIRAFTPLAERRGVGARTARWRQHAHALRAALDQHAWDGNWWLRGWYDDGTPLGSHGSTDCQMDGIAQSWSVIAQDAPAERALQAMEALDDRLVDRDARVVALLAPPFDQAPQDPGYIKGYPPGLRENGGQYTHGCVWAAIAFALLGDGDRAHELFSILQPISHADTAQGVARWKVEPYVACADVYTAPGHLGRGGWTWYTGTAGWLYRAATEWLLGIHVQGNRLRLDPCIPHTWPGFSMQLRWRSASYRIRVDNPSQVCRGVAEVFEDGASRGAGGTLQLRDDGKTHEVRAVLG